MKIEPRKAASLPKYAMLLAASAALLTGCSVGYAGEIQDTDDWSDSVADNGANGANGGEIEPVALDGDVVAPACEIDEQYGEPIKAGFARQGITLETAYSFAEYAGRAQETWYVDRSNAVLVCFYDDTSVERLYAEHGAQQYDWGFSDHTLYPRGQAEQTVCRTAFIPAIAGSPDPITEDKAEQIAKDLLADTLEETEVQTDEN